MRLDKIALVIIFLPGSCFSVNHDMQKLRLLGYGSVLVASTTFINSYYRYWCRERNNRELREAVSILHQGEMEALAQDISQFADVDGIKVLFYQSSIKSSLQNYPVKRFKNRTLLWVFTHGRENNRSTASDLFVQNVARVEAMKIRPRDLDHLKVEHPWSMDSVYVLAVQGELHSFIDDYTRPEDLAYYNKIGFDFALCLDYMKKYHQSDNCGHYDLSRICGCAGDGHLDELYRPYIDKVRKSQIASPIEQLVLFHTFARGQKNSVYDKKVTRHIRGFLLG